jgi:hypothetical protein
MEANTTRPTNWAIGLTHRSSFRLRRAISAQDAAILMPKLGLGIRIYLQNPCPSVVELKWQTFSPRRSGKTKAGSEG